jgi:Nucleotidyl transferase AbiEii toxin, Type IV TA system
MLDDEPPRSQAARAAAELALVRVAHYYGGRPEFVLLGGLVPALLCAHSGIPHAGTTDVDVQVNLEISSGAVNAARLEKALLKAEFRPDVGYVWRWRSDNGEAVIKFELLADLDNQPNEATIRFDGCEKLGAVNLRGTGLAVQDIEVRTLTAIDSGARRKTEVNVAGLAGFLVSKAAAARSRRKPKDWYDIAYVLLNSDYGDPGEAASRVQQVFGSAVSSLASTLADLRANFDGAGAQGTSAYVAQISLDAPQVDPTTAAADCQLAVGEFCDLLLGQQG